MSPSDVDPERKMQRTFTLRRGVVQRAQNTVWWTRNQPDQAPTLSAFVERAITAEAERVELALNDGAPFPPGGSLPVGPATTARVQGSGKSGKGGSE